MENVKKLLNAVKQAAGIETDYALAKYLEIRQARVSAYYSGKEAPNEFACLKISEALDMPLAKVIATVKAEAEKDEKRREEWRSYLKKLGGIAASVALPICAVVILNMTPTPAEAAPNQGFTVPMICIMLNLAWIAKVQTKLRSVGFPSCFGVFVLQVREVTAY